MVMIASPRIGSVLIINVSCGQTLVCGSIKRVVVFGGVRTIPTRFSLQVLSASNSVPSERLDNQFDYTS